MLSWSSFLMICSSRFCITAALIIHNWISRYTSIYTPTRFLLWTTAITTTWHSFWWTWVPQRIQYKLCVLVHGCLNGAAPGYLSDLTVSVASAARRRLCSASTSNLVVPSTRCASIGDHAFARLPWQVHERGTLYRQLSAQPPHRLLPLKRT